MTGVPYRVEDSVGTTGDEPSSYYWNSYSSECIPI